MSVLAPAGIILSKVGRAASLIGSTRPQSMFKFGTDEQDMLFLGATLPPRALKAMLAQYPTDKRARLATNMQKLAATSPSLGVIFEEAL